MTSQPGANNYAAFMIGTCPKCRGTRQICEDNAGLYLRCMNCGTIQEPGTPDSGTGEPVPAREGHKKRLKRVG